MRFLRLFLFGLLAAGAVFTFIRLGFWQLDRLEQRRSFNNAAREQIAAPALLLDSAALDQDPDLESMAYRDVSLVGRYAFEHEIALRNQQYFGTPGYRLFTPFQIEGTDRYILIDRGFVPGRDYEPGNWLRFAEPAEAEVVGVLRASQLEPDFGGREDPLQKPGDRLLVWNSINMEQVQNQMPFDLLPVFVQQSPSGESAVLPEEPASFPARTRPAVELTEGSHLSYAIQWFAFAGVVLIGFPIFILRERKEPASGQDSRGARENAVSKTGGEEG